jgi:hypothetical protein
MQMSRNYRHFQHQRAENRGLRVAQTQTPFKSFVAVFNPAYRYGSNSPIPTGSPEIRALTTFVLPVHSLGASNATQRGHAP